MKSRKEIFLVVCILIIFVMFSIFTYASEGMDEETFLKNLEGLGIKQDGTPLKVGIVFADFSVEFCIAGSDYPKWLLEKSGATVEVVNADYNLERQANMLDDFVSMGVDVIILQPVDDFAIAPKVIEIQEKGIPVFCFNHPPMDKDEKPVVRVGGVSPNKQMALLFVELIADRAAGREVKVAHIMGDQRQLCARDRDGGFIEGIKKYPNIKYANSRISSTWGPEEALLITEDFITADPDLFAIFANTDGFLQGVFAALRSSGKFVKIGEPGHIIIGSCDGSPYAVEAVRNGFSDMCVEQSPYAMASICAKAALVFAQGGKLPEMGEAVFGIEPVGITQENVGDESLWGNYGIPHDEVWPDTLKVWKQYRWPGDEIILDRFEK